MDNFSINVVNNDNVSVVSLVGMADMLIVDELDQTFNDIIRDHGNNIVVDLTQLDFICSIAISSLIRAHRECTKSETRFVLTSVPVVIERLLQTTQLDTFFEVFDSLENACNEF